MKKLKNFFKTKKGNMIIIVIGLVPVIFSVLSGVIVARRRVTTQKNETLISIDSFCDYVNEKYGKILKINGKDACSFSQNDRDEIKAYFPDYFMQIDGYNSYWDYKIEFEVNDDKSTYYIIKCTTWLPRLKGSTNMVDYWGIYDGKYKSSDANSWYNSNPNQMRAIYNPELDAPDKSVESEWLKSEFEVRTSCV